jgi:hypothetical protein
LIGAVTFGIVAKTSAGVTVGTADMTGVTIDGAGSSGPWTYTVDTIAQTIYWSAAITQFSTYTDSQFLSSQYSLNRYSTEVKSKPIIDVTVPTTSLARGGIRILRRTLRNTFINGATATVYAYCNGGSIGCGTIGTGSTGTYTSTSASGSYVDFVYSAPATLPSPSPQVCISTTFTGTDSANTSPYFNGGWGGGACFNIV